MADVITIRTDGKTIEARPCSAKHRAMFEGGYLVLSCSKCTLDVREPHDSGLPHESS